MKEGWKRAFSRLLLVIGWRPRVRQDGEHMSHKWFRKSGGDEDAPAPRPEEREAPELQRKAAAQRIVQESLERDRVALELAAKTIFRAGNVR